MDIDLFEQARTTLDRYLESRNHRKTPERYAILEAIYGVQEHFSIDTLHKILEKKKFYVSRATLYNTINLFLQMGLVVKHQLHYGTVYEVPRAESGHIQQICSVCGKATEVSLPQVTDAIRQSKQRNFTRENFMLYIYGTCKDCQMHANKKTTKR